MVYPLKEPISAQTLAEYLGSELIGGPTAITSVASLENAVSGSLVFASKPEVPRTTGSICITRVRQAPSEKVSFIYSLNPRLDFIRALIWLEEKRGFLLCRPVESIVHESVQLGRNVVIEPGCTLAEGVVIEPNVVIMRGTVIGARTRIRANATIGSDGFGFERTSAGEVLRFVHLGGVRIGEDVEIGANTCIARGTLDDTVIEDSVKIDNLVHIAHNVHIGAKAFVIAGAEISGGCYIGQRAWIGPNACVREKISIGEGALVGIGSTVVKDVPANEVHAGNPAKIFSKH